MRLSDLMQTKRVLDNLRNNQSTLNKLQDEVSSGKRMITVTDNPAEYSSLLQLKDMESMTGGYIKNIELSKGNFEMYESLTDQAGTILRNFKQLALQAANSPSYGEGRDGYLQRADDLLEDMVNLANNKMNGEFMFSGSLTQTQPFTTIKGVNGITAVSYHGDNQSKIMNPDSLERIEINLSGEEVFMGRAGMGESIFDEFISFKNDLGNKKLENIDAHLAKIDKLMARMLNKDSEIGSNVQHLENLNNFMEDYSFMLEKKSTNIEDVDLALAISQMLNQENVYKASLEVAARVNNTSILDYIR